MKLPADLPQKLFPLAHGFYNAIWDYRPKPGHLLEHLTHPDYWVNALQSGAIRPLDEIRAIAEDGSYYVQLLVEAVDPERQWAKTRVLLKHWHNEPAAPANDKDGYRIEFSGPHKWRILSPAGAVAAKGMASREEAEAALVNIKAQKGA